MFRLPLLPSHSLLAFCVFLSLLLSPSQAGAAREPSSSQESNILPVNSPKALPEALADGAAALEKENAALQTRTIEASSDLPTIEQDLQKLEIEVISIKAFLALQKLPASRVEELVRDYGIRDSKIADNIQLLTEEIEKLKKYRKDRAESLSALSLEIARLREIQGAEDWPKNAEDSYRSFLKLSSAHEDAASRAQQILQKRLELFQEQKGLLDELLPRLKNIEESWRVELLKRQEEIPLSDQVLDVWHTITVLPRRVQQWLIGLHRSGRTGSFIMGHAGLWIGLLAFIAALSWIRRGLNRSLAPRFIVWQQGARDTSMQCLLKLGRILISMIFPIGLTLWVGLAFRTLALLESAPALIILYSLIALVALHLLLRFIQALFGHSDGKGPLLPLDTDTADFYRRRLKAFSGYVFLGSLGLLIVDLLGITASVRQFLTYLFEVGLLIWNLILLRSSHLQKFLPEIMIEGWLPWARAIDIIRGAVSAIVVVIVLTYLLGFQSLSVFIARSSALTEGAVILWGLLSLAGREIIHYWLHAEEGWLGQRYPSRADLLKRLCSLTQGLFQILVTIAAIVAIMAVWGLPRAHLFNFLDMLTRGVNLGPVRLTPLNLALTCFVIYFGFRFSRFLPTLFQTRIFPKTGWDIGIRYTVSTIMQYVIVVLSILLALNVLGFPLANLALIMGAMGVGIGLGLQNLVSNFVSGLVLLIERPIKVGDMLIIDGHWGEVKEIRMRSTVFETYDRSVLIIPNTELTASKILNWTHFGRGINRIAIKIGVSYGVDVKQVTDLLMNICKANQRVVKEPAPQVYFEACGESSLNFNIWVFVRTPSDRIPATHELNSAIVDTFREHGIEIPYPQSDLHIKDWPEALGRTEDRTNHE
ncbi:MAG: mechanosensitive ion channel domain-containing protein [Syntrophobacteraceae bacterium]